MKKRYESSKFLQMTIQGRGNRRGQSSERGACLYFEEQREGQCGWKRVNKREKYPSRFCRSLQGHWLLQ